MDPIAIYLGTQAEQSLAVDVLSYSIAKHARQPVQITPLYQAVQAAEIDIPVPRDPQLHPRTPFTFQRFAIPALRGYRGRAIYLDSDMLVLRDIDEIWQQPFEQAGGVADLLSVLEPEGSGRSPQYSVMLLNCAQLKWDAAQLVRALEAGRWSYREFVLEMAPAERKAAALPLGWNDLERYTPGHTALVHYTDMPRQPWLSTVNPLAPLWCEYLLQAVAEGAIARETVQASIDKGWVRPSLGVQVERGIADPQQLPADVRRLDRFTFAPPHVWQKYLHHPALQGQRTRRWFSRVYATAKTATQAIAQTIARTAPPAEGGTAG